MVIMMASFAGEPRSRWPSTANPHETLLRHRLHRAPLVCRTVLRLDNLPPPAHRRCSAPDPAISVFVPCLASVFLLDQRPSMDRAAAAQRSDGRYEGTLGKLLEKSG